VGRGERVGLIKFGSRVDVFLNASAAVIEVKVGDHVKGGSSVLAYLNAERPLTAGSAGQAQRGAL
jgi:phosphatidylserine decarboxylase